MIRQGEDNRVRRIAVIMLVALSACQSPSGVEGEHAVGATNAEPSAASESESLFELSEPINAWINLNIAERCGAVTRASGDAECAKRLLLTAFDPTGQARSNCHGDLAIDLFAECVVYGSMAYELLERAGLRQEAGFDWQAPVTSLHTAFETLVDRNSLNCYGQEPTDFQMCYRREARLSLDLSEHYDTTCGDQEPGQWNQCILDAYVTNELGEASLRI